MIAVAVLVGATFIVLALWHVWMAFHLGNGESGAVPSADGKPLFVPSRGSTLLVAAVLTGFAGLVAVTARMVDIGLPQLAASWLSYALALGLAARAVGEFKYLGFFKRVRGSRFARLDTWLYSPLCVALAAGVAIVAHGGAP